MHQPLPRSHNLSGYLSTDTIAAIATALGGAIAVVRVSGPQAFFCLPELPQSPFRTLSRIRLKTPQGEEIDEALFVRFKNPESYTGEDVVEFQTHGGSFVASRLMETLLSQGIRQALPGEFSFRAVKNGKMSLSQAEAVSDLIQSSNASAASLALEKLSGTQNRLIFSLAEKIRTLTTLGEIGIDFSDQNIDEIGLKNLKEKVSEILSSLTDLENSFSRGSKIQEGISTAFVGLPNAGKSSFFNALLGEDRSIVSSHAGTTRDIIREKLTLHGKAATVTLKLEDTAGLRSTQNPVEIEGITRTEKAAHNAELLLFIVDPTQSIEATHEQWLRLGAPAEKTIGIVSKKDLLTPIEISNIRKKLDLFKIPCWVHTSIQTGEGIQEAIETITQRCEKWVHRKKGEVLLTRIDHFHAVQGAINHLKRAEKVTESDLFASDVRQALHSLSPLIGDTLPDDILGKIFSEFCIGK